jgi:hypothetical protein
MGKDFLRRRNDGFKRRRDATFSLHMKPDLFSACAPNITVSVNGAALGDVQPKAELWAPDISGTGPIRFFEGDVPRVEVDGPGADHLRRQYGKGTQVVAEVQQVVPEYDVVVLKVGCAR